MIISELQNKINVFHCPSLEFMLDSGIAMEYKDNNGIIFTMIQPTNNQLNKNKLYQSVREFVKRLREIGISFREIHKICIALLLQGKAYYNTK